MNFHNGNQESQKLEGQSVSDKEPRPNRNIKQPGSFNKMANNLKNQKTMAAGHSKRLETEVQKRTVELDKQVKKLEDTKLATLNIMEDMDEEHKQLVVAQQQLQKYVDELKEVDKKKDEFISISAHELKTPLTSIRGFVDLLKDEKVQQDKEARDKYLQIIKEDSERLSNLITNMLDLSRIEMGTIKFDYEWISVDDIANDIRNQMDIIIKQKKITSKYRIGHGLKIFSDRNRIVQVVSNLINNAVHYTPDGGRITISALKTSDGVTFSVSDTGCGIPKKAQYHIFERFFQVDSSLTRKIGGTGLGLSVSKGIVEALGGKMWFKSVERKGTTFFFTIPINAKKRQTGVKMIDQLQQKGYGPVDGLTEEALEEGGLLKPSGEINEDRLKEFLQKGFLIKFGEKGYQLSRDTTKPSEKGTVSDDLGKETGMKKTKQTLSRDKKRKK